MKKILLLSTLLLGVFISIQAQDSTLTQLTGKFKFGEGSPQKTGEDQYLIPDFQAALIYKRDSNKKVVGLTISVSGMVLEAVKVEAASFVDEKMYYLTR